MRELIEEFFGKEFGYCETVLVDKFIEVLKYIPEDQYDAGFKEGYEQGYKEGLEHQENKTKRFIEINE